MSLTEQKLFTLEEVAERTGRRVSTIELLLKHGGLRGVRVGDTWRVPESEVERLLNAVKEPPRDMPDEEWQARWDAVIAKFRSLVPDDLTDEEIEADIQAAVKEVRRERRERRARRAGRRCD